MYSTADLHLFVRTADSGSLTKAARDTGQSPAAASAAVKRLEQRLGAILFVRSTRSLRLTPEGEIFLEYCRSALSALSEGEAILAGGRKAIRGQLRLSVPSDLGRTVLFPWLNAFQEQHPALTLAVQFSDRMTDMHREPVDLAIRYGRLDDSSLVSQPLCSNRRVVVASPAYIARHGAPQSPQALKEHNCLLYYLKAGPYNTWRFWSGAEPIEIKVRGDRMADDAAIVREWAVAGAGIAYKSALDVRNDLLSGRLVTVLDGFSGEDYPLHAVYPNRQAVSPAAQALVACLRERLANPCAV